MVDLQPARTITVMCQDSSHLGKPVTVAEFWDMRLPGEESSELTEVTGIDFAARALNLEARTGAMLDAQDRVTDEDHVGETVRQRHGIRCPECGLDLAARAETLYPALHQLMAAGLSEVTLSALVRVHTR